MVGGVRIFIKCLCGMCSRLVCMERRDICKAFAHLEVMGNSAVKVSGHHPVFMDRLVMDGRLWRDTYRIRRSQMRNCYAPAPYLSRGFSDCEP